MIYNMANTFEIGRAVVAIHDATGAKVYQRYIECDTETGRVRALKIRDGVLFLDPETGDEAYEDLTYPAPLTVTFADTDLPESPKERAKYPDFADARYEGCTCIRWACTQCPVWHLHERDRLKFMERKKQHDADAQLRDSQGQPGGVPGDQG